MSTLTIEKLLEAQKLIDDLGPPPPGIDLYGHSLATTQDQAYLIHADKFPEALRIFRGPGPQRTVVIVPRARLGTTYRDLREAGIDVRLEPRYGVDASTPAKDLR